IPMPIMGPATNFAVSPIAMNMEFQRILSIIFCLTDCVFSSSKSSVLTAVFLSKSTIKSFEYTPLGNTLILYYYIAPAQAVQREYYDNSMTYAIEVNK